jgi:hypothetical protein
MNDIEIKKAISLLKADKDFIKNNLRATRHVFNEFDLAIQALEKQSPKKTKGNRIIICQICKNAYIDYLQKYCQDCGQKLDWSEVE